MKRFLTAIAISVSIQIATLTALAVPLGLIWNALAPIYGAGVLPVIWLQIPYLHAVGLMAIPLIIAAVFKTKLEFQK
jgi:hypothetical protein